MIMVNYFGEFINLLKVWIGNLMYNLIYKDMVYVVWIVKFVFIINVVLDEDKKIIGLFVGDMEVVYKVGCDFVKEFFSVLVIDCDIVILMNGGYLFD